MFIQNYFFILLSFFFISFSYNDKPIRWQMGFQDPATPVMEGIIDFYNHLMFFMVLVVVLVCWVLYRCIVLYSNNTNIAKFSHAPALEIVWTLLPTIILMVIAVPSFSLLYAIDAPGGNFQMTVKIVGHQWYWSYEYPDFTVTRMKLHNNFQELKYDSYMVPLNELSIGDLRLLETDIALILPARTIIRLLITASDVIHSWAIPSFGIKMDAVPGRVNNVFVYIKREGTFYGQCSEICGVNHGFMPITVQVADYDSVLEWGIFSTEEDL